MHSSISMEASVGRSIKRSRSESEDADECLPISKRINRLHIEPSQQSSSSSGDPRRSISGEYQQPQVNGLNNNSPNCSWQTPLPQDLHGFQNPPGASPPYYGAMNGTAGYYENHGHTVSQPSSQAQPVMPNYPSSVAQSDYRGYYNHPSTSYFSVSTLTVPSTASFELEEPGCSNNDDSMDYDPELDETENPYYYRVNNILFDAHIERLRREGRSVSQEPSSSFP